MVEPRKHVLHFSQKSCHCIEAIKWRSCVAILAVDLCCRRCTVSHIRLPFHFHLAHTSASYIYQKMARSKFTDDFTRLFVMPLGTCRVSLNFYLIFFSLVSLVASTFPRSFYFPFSILSFNESDLNCSQSNGTLTSNISNIDVSWIMANPTGF